MSAVFDDIITGVWPGRFVWADDVCAAFATIEPTSPGHILVVPRTAYDAWTDAPSGAAIHLITVVRTTELAQKAVFDVPHASLAIAGFEILHTHLHVIPLYDKTGILLSRTAPISDEEFDSAITAPREALLSAGYDRHVSLSMGSAVLA